MADINEVKSSRRVHLIVFSTYLFAFSNQAALSWSSPVLPQLRLHDVELNPLGQRITKEEEIWLASMFTIGNIMGLLPYGYLCYKLGRKYTLTSLGVLHLIGFTLYLSKNLTCFYVGRFLNGVAYGAAFFLFPMYIVEISRDSDRGTLIVSREIFSSCGSLFSYIAGGYLSVFWFNFVLCIFPILFLISFTILATESPYFLIIKENFVVAKKVYVELTSSNDMNAEEDVDEIRRAIEMSQTNNITETFEYKPAQKAAILVCFICIFQQLTGYMPFAVFTESILKKTHNVDPKNNSILIGIMFLTGSVLSTVFIDIIGRKLLLFISLTGIIIIEIIFSLYYFFFESFSYLPVICLLLFFLFFNLGVAVFPQLICAEIVPVGIKFKVFCAGGILGYVTAFLLTKTFLGMNAFIGIGWNILGLLFLL
ncbi:hypothetical protein WA026_006116 [Henosepilachna vigintioctopunctata]|uniref:Major facilitator superfamily (MFS) profile domain-containing protein n=1 Tax=Henosepilachna vigintioctopunctata TaxID=420089 RepID=A0AAW1TPC2_9CUCU